MKQYDNYYKDSGIAWLENVPNHWDIVPYKRAVIIKNGKDYKDVQVNEGGFPVIGSGGEFAKASNYLYDGEVILMGRKGTINKPLYFKESFGLSTRCFTAYLVKLYVANIYTIKQQYFHLTYTQHQLHCPV